MYYYNDFIVQEEKVCGVSLKEDMLLFVVEGCKDEFVGQFCYMVDVCIICFNRFIEYIKLRVNFFVNLVFGDNDVLLKIQ